MKNIRRYLFLTLLPLVLAACGGGSSTPPPAAKMVTLKLATTGTPSENLAGIDITVTLPSGVTPAQNSDGTVAATVVTVSGMAAPGSTFPPVYTPAAGATKGTLALFVSSNITAGFGSGEYATVVLSAAPGTTPLQSDFELSGFRPIAASSGADATGLTAVIGEYTVQ